MLWYLEAGSILISRNPLVLLGREISKPQICYIRIDQYFCDTTEPSEVFSGGIIPQALGPGELFIFDASL